MTIATDENNIIKPRRTIVQECEQAEADIADLRHQIAQHEEAIAGSERKITELRDQLLLKNEELLDLYRKRLRA